MGSTRERVIETIDRILLDILDFERSILSKISTKQTEQTKHDRLRLFCVLANSTMSPVRFGVFFFLHQILKRLVVYGIDDFHSADLQCFDYFNRQACFFGNFICRNTKLFHLFC